MDGAVPALDASTDGGFAADVPITDDAGESDADRDGGAVVELPPLGEVRVLETPCPRRSQLSEGQRCEHVEVDCQAVADIPTIRAELRISDPSGSPRGTIWLGSGARGGSFYADDGPSGDLVRGLVAEGYRVVERGWDASEHPGGWFTATDGVRSASCRSATLIAHVHARHRAEGTPLCASGNSGGSVELAYAMSAWRADRFLTLAAPTSGPVHRLDLGCAGSSDATWLRECGELATRHALLGPPAGSCVFTGPERFVDESFGGATTCSAPAGGDLPILQADSLVGPGRVVHFPTTRVRFLFGDRDGTGAHSIRSSAD